MKIRNVFWTIPTCVVLGIVPLHAVDWTWNGTSANWKSSNWSAGAAWPSISADRAIISSGAVDHNENDSASSVIVTSATMRAIGDRSTASLGPITLNAGGFLYFAGGTLGQINRGLILNGGSVAADSGASSGWGRLTLNSDLTAKAGTISSISAETGLQGATRNLNIETGATLNLDAWVRNANDAGGDFGGTPTMLVKSGSGLLRMSNVNTYTGGTTVNSGVLELSGASGGTGRIRGALIVNNGAQVRLTNDDGTGFGFNDARLASLSINGGTVTTTGALHIWNIGGGVTLSGGSLSSNGGVSSATSPQMEWGNTALTSNANSATSTVAGRLNIRRDAGSLLKIQVADGSASPDLLISAALTESATGCGLSKTGAGSLKLGGAVNLTGFITVNEGVLDLSSAVLGANVRINLLSGAQIIPPAGGLPATAAVFVNGQKLSPGTWGAPGSVAAGLAQYESPAVSGTTVMTVPDTGLSRRECWKTLKYGVFSHYTYLATGSGDPNEAAAAFNAEQYANDLATAGVQYVVWTAWHGNTVPMFPSQTMVKYGFPTRFSNRDTVGDMIDAVKARGIRVFLYTHPYQPITSSNAVHNNLINDLYAELVDRYGSRIDGLWIDENTHDGSQDSLVDYKRLITTIKERNPDLVTMQNGAQLYTVDTGGPEILGEWNFGWSESLYSLLMGYPNLKPEDMLRTNVLSAAANFEGGGVHWSIDGVANGGLVETSRIFAMGRYLSPIRPSVLDTKPSNSFPPPYKDGRQITYNNVDWVATTSTDDTKEFIHVLKPQSGNSINLPATADGKRFSSATLVCSLATDNGTAQPAVNLRMAMVQTPRGIRLTLPSGTSWSQLDTVIRLDVASKGGAGLVNDTSRNVTYNGSSWIYLKNRNLGEFNDDVHSTTSNGDSFTFTFSGTDVEYIATRDPNTKGAVDIYIDDVFQTTVDLSSGASFGVRQSAFRKSGLSRGQHALRCVKRSGMYMDADCFKVTELVNDSDPDVSYPVNSTYSADAAQRPAGTLWERSGSSWITSATGSYPATNPPNGDSFEFTFTGTEVQANLSAAYGSGYYAMYLDGVYQGDAQVSGPVTYSLSGLTNTTHTLKAISASSNPAGFIASFGGFVVTRPDQWMARSNRGFGEIGDDVHTTDINPALVSYNFNGSGVEVITTRDSDSRMAWFGVAGEGFNIGARRNNFALNRQVGTSAFSMPNLPPGNYSVSASHGANMSGLNFSFARLSIDAFRIYKAESMAADPLYWGTSGNGGSGTWDSGTTANWHDGGQATPWYDFGGTNYTAVFGGSGGTVNVSAGLKANRVFFAANGYTLQGSELTLSGTNPIIDTASGVTTTFATAPVAANGTITKVGAGTLNVINLTGNLNLSAGVIQLTGGHNNFWNVQNTVVGAGAKLSNNTHSHIRGLSLQGGELAATGVDATWGGWMLDNDVIVSGAATSVISAARVAIANGSGISRSFDVAQESTLDVTGFFEDANTTTSNGLTKNGPGTMILRGANTYTGSTTVNAGKLIISGSVTNTSAVSIAAGATLEISGSLVTTSQIINYGTIVFSGTPQMNAVKGIINLGSIINLSPTYSLPSSLDAYYAAGIASSSGNSLWQPGNGGWMTPGTGSYPPTNPPNGDYFEVSFYGTGIRAHLSSAFGYGYYVIYVDGLYHGTINVSGPTSYSVSGLPAGTHTLKAITATANPGGFIASFSGFTVTRPYVMNSDSSIQLALYSVILPLPWLASDIGTVGLAGSATAVNGVYTVRGSGTGVYASTDQCRMVYQTSSGDCDMIARVDSLTNPSVSAKVGVMIRESLATNARCAGVYVTPSSGVQFIWRTTAGSMPNIATVAGLTAPQWVRIRRVGNSFSAFYSSNGSTWTQFGGSKTISMSTSALMGQVVTSGTNSALCTGVFSRVSATP